MTGLECCHSYCTSCWTQYLSAKIMDEGASQSIECPEFNCNILVDDQTVLRLVKDSRTKSKYQQLITNSFVQVRIILEKCRFFAIFRDFCSGLPMEKTNLQFCFSSILSILVNYVDFI